MYEIHESEPAVPTKRSHGPRRAVAAVLLAGALGIIGVGSVFAADESTSPSSSPAASESADPGTEGGTESDGSGELCPERADDTATDESSS